jgi:Uma2 family endonuclease
MRMAVSTLLTAEEYLRSTEKPNAEFIDGVVRRKPIPTRKHGKMEFRVTELVDDIRGFDAVPEQTVKLDNRKYLVPDVAVQCEDELQEQPYPEKPIFLCIEFLSPEARFSELVAKCEDYHNWGVKYCWLIDPEKKQCWEYPAHSRPHQVPEGGRITAGELALDLNDLFAGF